MLYTLTLLEAVLFSTIYGLLRFSHSTFRWMKYYLQYGYWAMVIIASLMGIQTVVQEGYSTEIQMLVGGVTFFAAALFLFSAYEKGSRRGSNVVYRKMVKDFLNSFWATNKKKSTTPSAPCSVIRLEQNYREKRKDREYNRSYCHTN